jgi:RNA polymerase sigma factor (sigma-70 family)
MGIGSGGDDRSAHLHRANSARCIRATPKELLELAQHRAAVVDNPRMPPSPVPALDLLTIHRALAGDARAFARLYTSCQPLVLRAARRILGYFQLTEPSADLARDLAAEVWLRLLARGWRLLRAFDPARGSFRKYFAMVAFHQGLTIAHRWARRTQHEVPSPSVDRLASSRCEATALHHRMLLRRMLATVPPLGAVDLVLLEEGLLWQTPARELAPRLGQPAGRLRVRSHRLRARLRVAAQELEDETVRAA